MRKDFPIYEFLSGFNFNPGSVASANGHIFKSRKGEYQVTVRSSTITLETQMYDSFDTFSGRLEALVKAVSGVIDSDFFTRVGLRVINAVPVPRADEIKEWINPQLVASLSEGVFGVVNEYSQRIAGNTESGAFLFQHGVGAAIGQSAMAVINDAKVDYVLDYDFASEDISVGEAKAVVQKLNQRMYDLFYWSLGPKAIDHLGPSVK
jgi:uncharacterized protein (TIGR04255 family)